MDKSAHKLYLNFKIQMIYPEFQGPPPNPPSRISPASFIFLLLVFLAKRSCLMVHSLAFSVQMSTCTNFLNRKVHWVCTLGMHVGYARRTLSRSQCDTPTTLSHPTLSVNYCSNFKLRCACCKLESLFNPWWGAQLGKLYNFGGLKYY